MKDRSARDPAELLTRAAALPLLDNARRSSAIEGLGPPRDRIQRCGQVIGEAGNGCTGTGQTGLFRAFQYFAWAEEPSGAVIWIAPFTPFGTATGAVPAR